MSKVLLFPIFTKRVNISFNNNLSMGIEDRFCTSCGLGFLDDHPELRLWLKCRTCGFCKEINKEELSKIIKKQDTREDS